MATGLTALVDYGLCNIDSIGRILEELGARVEMTRDPHVIDRADRIVLPGVGAFGMAMKNLTDWKLGPAIRERLARSDVPFLGICLGMQLMATRSEEHGEHSGLDLIAGKVVRLSSRNSDERIPHIGWNEVTPVAAPELFEGIPAQSDFYFVHSFHFQAQEAASIAAKTPYCGSFISAVKKPGRLVYGTQFHPEKSQRHGQQLLRNFLAL